MVPQLQSVLVFVRDLDRSIFFYCGTLGLPLRSRWTGGAEVGAGLTALTLAVVEEGDEGGESGDDVVALTGRPTGMTFAVDRPTYERLEAGGVFSVPPMQYPWGVLCMVTDPDANEFALIAPAVVVEEDEVTSRILTRRARLALSSSAAPEVSIQ